MSLVIDILKGSDRVLTESCKNSELAATEVAQFPAPTYKLVHTTCTCSSRRYGVLCWHSLASLAHGAPTYMKAKTFIHININKSSKKERQD